MKQAIIYTRFSPRPNADESMSCEFQEQKAREYCSYQDMDILAVYQDKGASGKLAKNRPGLEAALVHVCRERAVLVCYNLARLTRSLTDLVRIAELIEKKDAGLALVTEHVDTKTPTGRAFFFFMGILAQWVRETTADHTSEVLKAMQTNGFRVSSKPRYGWMNDPDNPPKTFRNKQTGKETKIKGKTMKNPEEQEILRLMLRYHREGITPYYIARKLNEAGHMNRVGKDWHNNSVKRIIAHNNVKPVKM